jgi:predicted ATPase
MISDLTLTNFKCFANQKIVFGDLTLLAGANGSGKSSIIQSLLLLRQAYHQGELKQKHRLGFNGPLVKLGTMQDVAFVDRSEEYFALLVLSQTGQVDFYGRFPTPRIEGEKDALVASRAGFTLNRKSSLFGENFAYLSAERLGPRLWYPIRRLNVDSTTVGVQGEFAVDQLGLYSEQPLNNPALAYPMRKQVDSTALGYNVREWMRQIFPNLTWDSPERISKADLTSIAYGSEEASGRFRPINTGFGISYSLPIIVAGMLSVPGSLLIVENPEAHLHPTAQSSMGGFLAHVANAGTQVVIETHSDHILNGIRLAIKQKMLTPEQVSILFVQKGDNQNPSVERLAITLTGRIPAWPAGFFDQAEKDLIGLL